MATIIRAADAQANPQVAAFNLTDVATEAERYLLQVRAEAAAIIAEARSQADAIRQQAIEEGRRQASDEAKQAVKEQVTPALEALRKAIDDLKDSKQAWLAHWESNAVRLATAIAGRVVRHQIAIQPEITLKLVREALELAVGSPGVRLHMNPKDHKALGSQVRTLVKTMSALADAEVVSDATISQGGCRVETRFGAIDQQIESQLQRIEEELTQ